MGGGDDEGRGRGRCRGGTELIGLGEVGRGSGREKVGDSAQPSWTGRDCR